MDWRTWLIQRRTGEGLRGATSIFEPNPNNERIKKGKKSTGLGILAFYRRGNGKLLANGAEDEGTKERKYKKETKKRNNGPKEGETRRTNNDELKRGVG